MTVRAFEVMVGVSHEDAPSPERAIADATKYLAYADQTDTFGYRGDIIGVETFGDSPGDWSVALTFTAPIVSDDDHKAFMDEMAALARVETVEEVAYQEV